MKSACPVRQAPALTSTSRAAVSKIGGGCGGAAKATAIEATSTPANRILLKTDTSEDLPEPRTRQCSTTRFRGSEVPGFRGSGVPGSKERRTQNQEPRNQEPRNQEP